MMLFAAGKWYWAPNGHAYAIERVRYWVNSGASARSEHFAS